MTTRVRVSLGGIPLNVARGGSLSWQLSYGVQPYVESVTLDRRRGEAIFKAQRPRPTGVSGDTRSTGQTRTRVRNPPPQGQDLVFESGRTRVVCKGVQVLSAVAGPDPNNVSLVLADRRWTFRHAFVERSYNIRRRGQRRRLVGGEVSTVLGSGEDQTIEVTNITPEQLKTNVADYIYHRASLNKEKPWTAREVLEDVLTEVAGAGNFKIGDLPYADFVEDLDLHDPGDQALSRVLGYFPGAEIFVGLDGKIHVTTSVNKIERKKIDPLPIISGSWELVDNSSFRPARFDVFFDREVELRFNYEQKQPATPGNSVAPEDGKKPGREPLDLENVIINPLLQLKIPRTGKVATQGEAVPVDDYLEALNTDEMKATRPGPPVVQADITHAWIEEGWMGRWQYLVQAISQDVESQQYRQDWLLLFSALRTGWRQVFRVLPQWRDKVRNLKARRTAIMDAETGTLAPATAHLEYLAKFSQLGVGSTDRVAKDMGYTFNDYSDDLSESNISPFKVQVIDADRGLIRVAGVVDQTGLVESYVAGAPITMPNASVRDTLGFWGQTTLKPTFQMAIVLTATQAVPNNIERMQRISVYPAAAAKALGLGEPRCNGPVNEIASSVHTSKHAWRDGDAEKIRLAFFEGKDMPLPLNLADLKVVAVTHAAREMARSLDQAEGHFTTPLVELEPGGNLQSVTYTAIGGDTGGAIVVECSLPHKSPPINLFGLMPEGTRRLIRREVTND